MLIDEVLDEGPIDSDDEDEEDAAIVSEHYTSSEQEGDEDDEEEVCENNYYLGKDRMTKWRKEISRPNIRTRSHNIIIHLPCVRGDAKQCATPLECFKLFISSDIIEQIVLFTNKRIDSEKGKYSQK